MSDIFISYSRDNKVWVSKLAKLLEAEGYDVWWDPEILAGQDFEEIIQQELKTTKCVITVWSEASIKSRWVKEESSKALDRGILIPILHEHVTPPMPFGRIHTDSLEEWRGKSTEVNFQKLLRAISIHTRKKNKPPEIKSPKPNKTMKIVVLFLFLGVLVWFFTKGTGEETEQRISAASQIPTTSRFVDHSNGTITDKETSLMWKKCSEGQTGNDCSFGDVTKYTWDDAKSTFTNNTFTGYGDWRLPTIGELRTLIYCSNGVTTEKALKQRSCGEKFQRPTIDHVIFPNTGAGRYWSLTEYEYASIKNSVWVVSFFDGSDSALEITELRRVRLVRALK